MADPNFKKISEMVALTTAATDDIIPIVDVSEAADADKNKKITTANLRKNITNAELAGSITTAKIAGLDSDPGADRMVFWDYSASSLGYLTAGSGLQFSGTTLNAAAVSGTEIADDAIDSNHIADGAIDLAHMSANSVDSDQYVDGSIDRVHLAADIVDGTKIADDSINSEHYVDGSIDQEHLSVGASKVTNRQGGSATNWNTVGTTNYAAASARIQCGVILTSGTITVTFPVAFSQVPVVFLTSGFHNQIASVDAVTASGFTGVLEFSGDSPSDKNVNWLAIGAA
jgi:hypothetical protein